MCSLFNIFVPAPHAPHRQGIGQRPKVVILPTSANTLKEWKLALTQQKKSSFVFLYMMEVKNISCYCPVKERRVGNREY
jgi:hypothetical protein